MSFISDVFGGSSKNTDSNQSSQQNINQNTTQNQTQNVSQSQTGSQKQTGTQTQNVNTLDDATQQLLHTIIGQVGTNVKPLSDAVASATSSASPVVANLASLFGNAPANTDQIVNNAVGAAKLAYESGEGNQIEQQQQFTGSIDNSASELLAQKGARDEATTLGNVAGQTRLSAEDTTSRLGTNVLTALSSLAGTKSQSTNDLTNLLNVLKGASTTGTTATASDLATSNNALSNLVSNLTSSTSGTSTGTQSGTSTTNFTPSLLDTLNGLLLLGSGQGNFGNA